MEQRVFGKTKETLPILGFGAQRLVDSQGCSEEEAKAIVNHALDHGIVYFDTAWVYSEGQSEERLGKVARHRRQEMWIATKAWSRTKIGARRQLEESLRRLQTDHVDEWRMHHVWSIGELDKITGPRGALEAARKAREQGLVRYISISGHNNPQVQTEAVRRFPFDSVLCPVSVMDHFVLSFAEELLPLAASRGVAIIGMKVLALGRLAHIYDRALRYAFGLPLSVVIVGMETMDQLKRNLAIAESYQPLTDAERLDLFKEVLPLVSPDTLPWKAENWSRPAEWTRR